MSRFAQASAHTLRLMQGELVDEGGPAQRPPRLGLGWCFWLAARPLNFLGGPANQRPPLGVVFGLWPGSQKYPRRSG